MQLAFICVGMILLYFFVMFALSQIQDYLPDTKSQDTEPAENASTSRSNGSIGPNFDDDKQWAAWMKKNDPKGWKAWTDKYPEDKKL